MRINKLETH